MATAHPGGADPVGSHDRAGVRSHPVRLAALIVGLVFLVVGVLGFVPGITTNYDDLGSSGPESQAKLLGLFLVSTLHNIVHIAFGVLGLLAARTVSAARLYLIGGGVLYLVLTLYGVVIDRTSDANFVPVNMADNALHLVLGLGMIALGVVLTRTVHRDTTAG